MSLKNKAFQSATAQKSPTKRREEPHYLITVEGDIGQQMVEHAKVGHEMTVQGRVNGWGSSGMLYIGGDKLIRVD